MSDAIIDDVKDKLYFVMKEPLINYAFEKGIISKKAITREDAKNAIINAIDLTMANELVERFSSTIGFISSELENRLNITSNERKKWTKKGYLKISGTYQTRAYGTYLDCPIYDLLQVLSLTQDDIERWRSETKPITEKRKAGIAKGQETALKNRTCLKCGFITSYKHELENGLCPRCIDYYNAMESRRQWLEHKEEYVILDTETTGLSSEDEIIEIAIIDMDGNVLLNTLVMPTVNISSEAIGVHGINMNELCKNNAPKWADIYLQVKAILNGKKMIAYNAEFDDRMIRQTCRANYLEKIEIDCVCLMYNEMLRYSTENFISLRDKDDYNYHRALDDCFLCLDLIKEATNVNRICKG